MSNFTPARQIVDITYVEGETVVTRRFNAAWIKESAGGLMVYDAGLVAAFAPGVWLRLEIVEPEIETCGTADQNGHEAAATEWQREQWRIRQGDRTRLKLAELASASTMPALSEPVPAQSGHACEKCEREFATVQALNAHKRFCVATYATRQGE